MIGLESRHLRYKQHHRLHRLLEAQCRGALFRASILSRCKFNHLHHPLYRLLRRILCSRRTPPNSKSSKFPRRRLSIFTTGFLPHLNRDRTKSLRRLRVKTILLTSRMPPFTCDQNTSTRPKSARRIRTRLLTHRHNLVNIPRRVGDRELIRTHVTIVHSSTRLQTRRAVPIVGNVTRACLRLTAAVSVRALHGRKHVRGIRLARIKDDGRVDLRNGRGRRAHDGRDIFALTCSYAEDMRR